MVPVGPLILAGRRGARQLWACSPPCEPALGLDRP